MKIVFLGTNGWFTTPTGNTPCILIDSKTHYVVFDAGNGIYKIDKYIKENKPIALFVSHFHIDHISGLHTLGKFVFPQGIDIFVAKGRKKDFENLVNPPYTIGYTFSEKNINNLRTNIRLHELSPGKHDVGFPVEVFKLYHAYRGHGYKVTLDNKTIAYSGDTRVGPNSLNLARNTDVLIHECSYIEQEKGKWGHVNPLQAAQLAKNAKVKQLVLTHFDASLYTTLEKRESAEKSARKIFPATKVATDDMVLRI